MSDALPLSRSQLVALFGAAARELGGGLRGVSRELRRWRRRALSIPNPALRADALFAIDHKRGHTDGAALFWTLPHRRDARLLRALVTYELLQDYLDCVSERAARVGAAGSAQLYVALTDAVEPERQMSDHYRDMPWKDDAGFLADLIAAFRRDSAVLPSYAVVQPHLRREATRATVLDANHMTDFAHRDAVLRAWAEAEFPWETGLQWYELTAAASGWITTHALLALASEHGVSARDVETTYSAYFPWFALSLTMLDSYVDQADDARTGDHSYFSRYPTGDDGVLRLCASLERSAEDVLGLPHGERHAVLLSCMIALYLSKDSARTPAMSASTRMIVTSAGQLPRLLLPVLRLWRIRRSQTTAT